MTDLPDLPVDDTYIIGLNERNVDRDCNYCGNEALAHVVANGDDPGFAYAGYMCADHINRLCDPEMGRTRGAPVPEESADNPDESKDLRPLPKPSEEESDGLTAFVTERLRGGEAKTLTATALHKMYDNFCEDKGYEAASVAAMLGHLTLSARVELESADEETDGLERPILVRGVVPV